MEVFEIHITGDNSIHEVAKRFDHKTIAIDLLRPNKSCIRTEHMTSFILRYPYVVEAYPQCKALVDKIVEDYRKAGVKIIRVKIESPFYDHYEEDSLYMESHFVTDLTFYPISRNQRKTELLATDREYDHYEYESFRNKHDGKELELCLYDTFPDEDADWFREYEEWSELSGGQAGFSW